MNMNQEVISGHLVTAEKKQIFSVYLDLLQEFDRLCKNKSLTYFIMYGSLIGAVRHKGFIPWDDDVDIIMPREDFDKLLLMTQADFGTKDPYFLQNEVTDPTYHQTVIRFRRSNTSSIMDYDLAFLRQHPGKSPYNMGMGLSIFPLDNVPQSGLSFILRKKAAFLAMGIDFRANRPAGEKPWLYIPCRFLENIIGAERLVRFMHRCFRCPGENKRGQVHCLSGFYPNSTIWDASDFAQALYLPFETLTVPVPVGYDHVLRVGFGDYMQLPPEEQRREKHEGFIDPNVPYLTALETLMIPTAANSTTD